MSDKRQKNQLVLAFTEEGKSEAPKASQEGTESLTAKCETERPASHEQLMEEVCERENCWQAYKRVKANRGSPGIDGMKVGELSGYLKQHWPTIREQLLGGTYQPQPVRRVEIPKPDVKVGVLENGLVSPAEEGTPQGGPLSPLLSNIVLDELDRELERRKHRFVRYADDCNIYVRSRQAGQRVMRSVTRFLARRLKLKVNEAKSAVARPEQRKFLGFSFSNNKEPKRRIAPKVLLRCKQKIRELTRRTRGISLEQMLKELAAYLRGWKSYFGFCQTPFLLQRLDRWIRHRLRSMIWKQWKYGQQRYGKLRQRGVGKELAAQTAGSRHGPWRVANSPALSLALPLAYFDSLGLPRLSDGLA